MRTHQLVLQWIESQLLGGNLALGGRLPAERTLAEQLRAAQLIARIDALVDEVSGRGAARSGVISG